VLRKKVGSKEHYSEQVRMRGLSEARTRATEAPVPRKAGRRGDARESEGGPVGKEVASSQHKQPIQRPEGIHRKEKKL
jgi:hypothetical protein